MNAYDRPHAARRAARFSCALLFAAALCSADEARASFHFMQIEQASGGVAGDVTQQAVQLRMRFGGQNLVQQGRLRAFDANGANPVLLLDIPSPVTNGSGGDRVLIATSAWAAAQDPAPDFTMAPIPASYLAGGRLTFEEDDGSVVFALCWGSYAGSNAGTFDNDGDGNFGACEPGALPSEGLTALRFTGAANAASTNNAADFETSASPATFTNNARLSAALVAPPAPARGGDCHDGNDAIGRGRAEVAGNRVDDDCDGLADEDAQNTPSLDSDDSDGDGQSIAAGDCDGTTADRRLGAEELVGDRRDNDCDGFADEAPDGTLSFDLWDHDGDGEAMFARVWASGFEN